MPRGAATSLDSRARQNRAVTRHRFMTAALLLAIGACTPAPTLAPPTAGPTAGPSAAAVSASPSAGPSPVATPAGPGSIQVEPCPPVPSNTACLGDQAGTIAVTVAHAKELVLLLNVHNPGGTTSSPVAILVYVLDAASPLPFGAPDCTTCSSTASRTVIGIEWPALAPGETRIVSVPLPVTGATGTAQAFVDLYPRPLADVVSDEMANGITPGQESWKLGLSIRG
jgi:hypothetical protein